MILLIIGKCRPYQYDLMDNYTIHTCTSNSFGAACELQCAPGYHGVPNKPVCQTDGTWSDAVGCVSDGCPPMTPPVGFELNFCNGNSYGSVCYLDCDPQYSGTADSVICRESGTWSTPYGCIKLGCGNYVLYDPAYDVISCSQNTFGSVCLLNCSAGYTGSAVSPVCLSSGSWTSPSGCSIRHCPSYVVTQGYRKVDCSSTSYGDVWYVCRYVVLTPVI